MAYPMAGVNGDVWTTATPSVALGSPETCTDSGDHITYSSSVHTFWDWTQTFTVQNSPNGSTGWVTVTDYTVQWAIGRIVFNTARVVSTNNFVRISAGSYFTASQLDASHQWSMAQKGMTKDTTSFQATGAWATHTPTIKQATGKIATYRNENRMGAELNNMLAFQLFIDKANNVRWQFYGIVTQVDPASDVNGVQTQTINFQSVRDIYFLTS